MHHAKSAYHTQNYSASLLIIRLCASNWHYTNCQFDQLIIKQQNILLHVLFTQVPFKTGRVITS